MQLFEQKGFDATTLEDISTLADVSRPTLYKYFSGKHELVQALVENLWLHLARQLTADTLADELGTKAYIQAFFQMIEREFKKYNQLERELIRQSMVAGAPDSYSVMLMKALTDMFASVYRRGKRQGEIRSDFPVDFLAEMTMGAINTVMMNWAVDEAYPIDRRLKQLHSWTWKMLVPDK